MSKVIRQSGDSGDPSNTLLNLLASPFNTEIQSDAIAVSLATSLGLTFIIVLVFCFLRPHNTIVYAPRQEQSNSYKVLPQLRRGLFSWVEPIIKANENDYVDAIGLDATLFIRFTFMCRNIFIALTVFGCGIIIPVNIFGGKKLYNVFDGVPAIAKITPQYVFGEATWAYVVCAYVFDTVVAYFLWLNYRDYVQLRRNLIESNEYQRSLHARTLMITDIPEISRNTENILYMINNSSSSATPVSTTIARDVKGLPKLVKEHDDTVQRLELFLSKHVRDFTGPSTPILSFKSSCSDGIVNRTKTNDTFAYLNDKLKDLNKRINNARELIDEQNSLPYGFVGFDRIVDAHSVARLASNKQLNRANMQLAPRIDDLLWDNLSLSRNARQRKAFINNIWVMILTIIWIVPNVFIAIFLSNLTNLGNVWPDFQKELLKNPHFWAIVQAVAAPAILSLVYFYLPSVIRRLSMRTGIFSKTARDRHVLRKLYTFFVFNNLIIFSLFSAAWAFTTAVIAASRDGKSASDAIREGRLLEKVLQALCNGSFFWVMWLLQRNLVAAKDLLQIWSLAWGSFVRKVMRLTPRQAIEWTAPPQFDYASYYNYFLFYATVALCYSVLQPLILPVAALYFSIDTWMKKYLLLYVFSTKNESNGQIWNILFNRLLFALLLSNVVVLIVVAAQGYNVYMLVLLAPLPFFIGAFKFYCIKRFDRLIQLHGQYRNLEVVDQDNSATETSQTGDIATQYRHPVLTNPLLKPLIYNYWVEQVNVLIHNMHVESKCNEGEAASGNHEINQKQLFSPDPHTDFGIEFDIFRAQKTRSLQNACSSDSHTANAHKPHDPICLTEFAPRSLSVSGAASTNYCCDSFEVIDTNKYHKVTSGVRVNSPYTDTFATSAQQSRPNEASQRELLLPNSAPMAQVYSDVSTPGSVKESEPEYF